MPPEHDMLDKYLADIRGWVAPASVDLEGGFECMGYWDMAAGLAAAVAAVGKGL